MRRFFLTRLFAFMTIAFITTFAISYFIQTGQGYDDAERLIYLKIDDVIKQIQINNDNLQEIRQESDANALAKVRSFAEMLRMNPGIVGDALGTGKNPPAVGSRRTAHF